MNFQFILPLPRKISGICSINPHPSLLLKIQDFSTNSGKPPGILLISLTGWLWILFSGNAHSLKTFLIRMSLTCVSESVKSVASFCRSLLVKYFFRSKAFSRCWICCRVNTVLDFFFLGGGDDELLMLSSSADEMFFKSSTDDVEWPENMRIFITLSIPDKVN